MDGKSLTFVNKYIRLLFGIFISLIGLYYAFANIDWKDFTNQLLNVNYYFLLFSVILMIFSVYIRALRWRYILLPVEKIKLFPLFGSTMIGYFGNSVLPFRLGEILRAVALSTQSTATMTTVMGTIILERFLDMAGLILVIITFTVISPLNNWIGGTFYLIVIFTIIGLVLALILNRNKDWFASRKSNNVIIKKIFGFIKGLLDGFTVLQNSNKKLNIFSLSIILWILYYFSMMLVVKATGLGLTWTGTGILLIATTLSIIIPAAPGYFGTYHAATIFVLTSMYGITRVDSQAFAVLAHAVGFVPFVVIGAIFFIKSSVSLSQLKR
jgi:uncharacterized protein (TIRG00374 family)